MNKIISDWQFLSALRAGEHILDLSCSRAGETATELASLGCRVWVTCQKENYPVHIDNLLKKAGVKSCLLSSQDYQLPFADNTFTAVIVHKESLPTTLKRSLARTKKAMAEVHRVLKPEGQLLILGRNIPAPVRWLRRLVFFPLIPIECGHYDKYLLEGLKFQKGKSFRFYPRFENYIYVLPFENNKSFVLALKFLLKNFRASFWRLGCLFSLAVNIRARLNLFFYDYYLVDSKR